MEDLLKRQVTSTIDTGDTAFVLICTMLIMIMVPAIGLFYSGLSHSKNALYLIMLGVLSFSIVSIQWVLFGYSLIFSNSSNSFIGNLKNALFINVGSGPSSIAPSIPELVFSIFQCMFATITPAIALGSACHRINIIPLCIFIFAWTTFAYDPIAYWNWSQNGWLAKLGSLDFAGGTVIHITSGFTALTLSLYFKFKCGYSPESHKPRDIMSVFLGTLIVWFGWYGFNCGSALSADARSAHAFVTTNTSAVFGGITMVALKYFPNRGKCSIVDFCVGVFSGLIGVTPACGYVNIWASIIIGVVSPICCFMAFRIKTFFSFNDEFDVFATHAVSGIVGSILTGIFSSKKVADYNSWKIQGGWIDHNWKQVPIQLAAISTSALWSVVWTLIIVLAIEYLTPFKFLATKDDLVVGADDCALGESLYGYIECSKYERDPVILDLDFSNKLSETSDGGETV
ncbi:hypothetical protein BB560_006090 [Smittium megazygosporum]|uniref:Ammonium transporter n=1 Tax=Smittium megazygosporum TaxID=133381 RepID=A0A2T9YI01_9FUNG|nr:hypothetical protein BB560_006090 [Smittium megazygosporum]